MELANGYKMKTTFWADFSIADRFGIEAIKDTYERALEEWIKDIEYMTELSIVLNHKIWQWYDTDKEIASVYNDLWREIDTYICENFKDDEIKYYLKITD